MLHNPLQLKKFQAPDTRCKKTARVFLCTLDELIIVERVNDHGPLASAAGGEKRSVAEKAYQFESVTMVTLNPELSRPALPLRGKTQRFLQCRAEQTKDGQKKDSGGSPRGSVCLSETEARSARLTLGANTLPGGPGEAAGLLKA